MTANGYRVEPAELVTHAGSLDDAAETVRSARSAANAVGLGKGAYGKLLSWVPEVFSHLQDTIIAGLADGERAVRDSADDMRLAAKTYNQTDLDAARSYRVDRLA
jgi:hypothetical protein